MGELTRNTSTFDIKMRKVHFTKDTGLKEVSKYTVIEQTIVSTVWEATLVGTHNQLA